MKFLSERAAKLAQPGRYSSSVSGSRQSATPSGETIGSTIVRAKIFNFFFAFLTTTTDLVPSCVVSPTRPRYQPHQTTTITLAPSIIRSRPRIRRLEETENFLQPRNVSRITFAPRIREHRVRNERETFPLSARNVDQSATVTTGCVTVTVKVSACAQASLSDP